MRAIRQKRWRSLNLADNGERLMLTGLKMVGYASEVVVAVSQFAGTHRLSI